MLVNMKKILEIAEAEGYAIPCINTPNEETVRAVIGAAEELNTPIIIDHAQVHDSLIPIERIGPIMLKYAKEARVPVCVHLDHGSDYEFVMRAVKAVHFLLKRMLKKLHSSLNSHMLQESQ